MWAEACGLIEQAERLHRQFFRPGSAAQPQAHWEPPIDVLETSQQLRICEALPGVAPERIHVGIQHDALLVSALRPGPSHPAHANAAIRRLEIPYGRFERRIALPPGEYELLEQAFSHGCLELRLAKRGITPITG